MKKSFLFSNLVLSIGLLTLASCASSMKSAPVSDDRLLASKNYECNFTSTLAGVKTTFSFVPERLELKVGRDTLYLQEHDIIAGGFAYVQGDEKIHSQWNVSKVEFYSLNDSPKISVKMQKSNGPVETVSSVCAKE
ncbi:MAG: hypothetical protein K2Q18_02970 [Bdellovibrionales bacterium]|nr:hypothetical protein [Bdellovibrionales bacterium]